MLLTEKVLGLNISVLVVIMAVLILIEGIVLILTIRQLQKISRKYYALTSGKKASDLENVMLTRFKEMDRIKARVRKYSKQHKGFKGHLDKCLYKVGLIKYDAFDSMAGELSFSLALLNEDNSGVVLSTMHSKEGCFSYAKEIIGGESYIALSKEEKEAIRRAESVEEEIERLTNTEEDDENIM